MSQELKTKLILKSIKYRTIIAIIITVTLALLGFVAPTGGTVNPKDASIF
ncbi:MAG: hypothetical protein QXL96_09160 [Ignisphaera sp.]